jgi:hypothetical protein
VAWGQVSEYLGLLLSESAANASLSIPNVVDDTYTGVIYINASVGES